MCGTSYLKISQSLFHLSICLVNLALFVLLQQLSVPIVSLAALPAALDPAVSALAVTGAGGVSSSAQPPLMGNVDPSKVNEIRRTVYVGNLNSQVTGTLRVTEVL